MSHFRTSSALTAILALTGCTAAFLVPQEASATQFRAARASVSRPAPRPTRVTLRAPVQSHVARQTVARQTVARAHQTFVRPQIHLARPSFTASRPISVGATFARHTGFSGLPHRFGGFPAANSLGGHVQHATFGGLAHLNGGNGLPRPNSIGTHLAFKGGVPHLNGGNGLPRPNSIGTHAAFNGAFQHANLTGTQHLALNGAGLHFGGGLAGQTGDTLHGLTHANFNALAGNNHANGDHKGDKGNKGVQGSAIKLGELKQDLKTDQKKLGDAKKGLKTDNTKLTAANNAVTAAKAKEASDAQIQNALLTGLVNAKANNATPAQIKAMKNSLALANAAASADHTSTVAAQTAAATAQTTANAAKKTVAADKKDVAGDRKDVKDAKQTLADKTKIAKENREIKQLQNQVSSQAAAQPSGTGQAASNGDTQQASSGDAGGSTSSGSSSSPAPTAVSVATTAPSFAARAPVQQLAAQEPISTPAATDPQTTQSTPAPAPAQTSPEFVVVVFQQGISDADASAFLDAYKVSVVDGPSQDGSYKLQLKDPIPADQLQQLVDSMKSQTNIVSTAGIS